MEHAIRPKDFPYLPRPLTVATMTQNGIIPYAYQVKCAEGLYRQRNVFCMTSTGSGKTLILVMLCFFCRATLVWIVLPLNSRETNSATSSVHGDCTLSTSTRQRLVFGSSR